MPQTRLVLFTLLILSMHSAHADMFDIQLGNNSGRIIYASEISGSQNGPLDMEFGLYFNQDKDKLAHAGIMVRNDTLDSPLVISVGARLYYGDVGHPANQIHAKFAAIAIGGEILFIPNNLGGLGFGASYYGAPKITSYMDAEGYREYGLRINYEITRQADISLGYRNIKVDLSNNASVKVESRAYVGVGLRF